MHYPIKAGKGWLSLDSHGEPCIVRHVRKAYYWPEAEAEAAVKELKERHFACEVGKPYGVDLPTA